jgi:hypothetical protein
LEFVNIPTSFGGVSAYDGRFTQFVLKTEQGSFSREENASVPVTQNFMK